MALLTLEVLYEMVQDANPEHEAIDARIIEAIRPRVMDSPVMVKVLDSLDEGVITNREAINKLLDNMTQVRQRDMAPENTSSGYFNAIPYTLS